MENRSENRSTNCKNQTSNRTSSKTTNSATNEHKHPNQYTKGADDETPPTAVPPTQKTAADGVSSI